MPRPSPILLYGAFALLTLIWGTTWAVIRIGLVGIPPFTGVALRFAIAALALFLLSPLLGVRFGRSRREYWLWPINAIFSFCLSYGIVYWGEQWVPSGLASVLFSTFPLFVAIMAHFSLRGERLMPWTITGIATGFAGVAVIFSEDLDLLGEEGAARAAVIMLLSPLSAAVAQIVVKRWGGAVHPVSITAVPMGIATGVMGAVAVLAERGRPMVFDATSVGALLYLALLGSAVTFTLYYWLLIHLPATRLALMAFLIPVVAVLVGALAMGERVTWLTLAGSALVVAGVALAVFAGRPAPNRGPAT